MTAADTNVRPGWRGNATTARRTGGSLLACLLLYFRKHLYKLDRKPLLLLFAASLTPACIIPVGPEFQDPPGVPNSPPYAIAPDPVEGWHSVSPTAEFTVTPADVNVGDPLFVKWVTDYPPFSDETHTFPPETIPPPANGSLSRPPQSFRPECGQLGKKSPTHTISVGISDRAFVTPENPSDLFAAQDKAPVRVVIWTLERSCPSTP
jgi:hypothetical protein